MSKIKLSKQSRRDRSTRGKRSENEGRGLEALEHSPTFFFYTACKPVKVEMIVSGSKGRIGLLPPRTGSWSTGDNEWREGY